jgi:hypothetical protein
MELTANSKNKLALVGLDFAGTEIATVFCTALDQFGTIPSSRSSVRCLVRAVDRPARHSALELSLVRLSACPRPTRRLLHESFQRWAIVGIWGCLGDLLIRFVAVTCLTGSHSIE